LLKGIIEEGEGWSGFEIFEARLQLTEILMEEFRVTLDSNLKLTTFNELKKTVLGDHIALADDFNPYGSETTIPLALMARRVGSPSEFQDGLEKTFHSCIEALKDNEGLNDRGGFRLLAKVLACVPGLEKDAQISLSLQFSIVDQSVYKTDESAEMPDGKEDPDKEKEDPKPGAGTNGTMENGRGVALKEHTIRVEIPKEPADSDPTAKNMAVDEVAIKAATEACGDEDEEEEDLEKVNGPLSCNACSSSFPNWKSGSIYLCIICTGCDLCEEDYHKRLAMNRGEEFKDVWKTFCGPNHRYIRGPIKEWKGVKDGVIRYGEVRVEFTEWLRQLSEEKWKEAWRKFWGKDEGLKDIL
jgi:hypothetical protein